MNAVAKTLGCLAVLTTAASGTELPALFPYRAPLTLPSDGQNIIRVDLPPEVLRQAQADLSDVRVLTGDGREVPFEPVQPTLEAEPSQLIPLQVSGADRRERPALRNEPAQFVETYQLTVPGTLPSASGWMLELTSAVPEFVRHVEIQPTQDHGSIFRLKKMEAQRLTLPLRDVRPNESLTVTLTGQGGGYLSPEFRLISKPAAAEGRTLSVEIPTERKPFLKETVLSMQRPAGFRPVRLRFATSTPLFGRRVQVFDVDPQGASHRLGDGHLFRVPGPSGGSLEELEVPLTTDARGAVLEVRIEDGDSGALEKLSVSLILQQPAMVLAVRPGGPFWLYFGGGRSRAPSYDLARLSQGTWRQTEHLGSVGAVQQNPAFRSEPLLRPFIRAGAEVDERYYAQRFPITMPDSGDGLTEIRFAPEAAALLRDDAADVRVVDGQKRQWPFLLSERTETQELPLGAPRSENGWSEYAIALPASPSWVTGVDVLPTQGYFARKAELCAYDDAGARTVLTREELRNNPMARGAGSSLSLKPSGGPHRAHRLALRIQDQEDAPLEGLHVRLELKVPVALAVTPPGRFDVLVGNPQAQTARYDLDSARDIVLAVRPALAHAEPLRANPSYERGLALAQRPGGAKLAVWGVMALAVVALGLLALRMART